ncbi:MAG: methylated-DNA--[protein]-cysteine S-methyltransferase [Nitrospinota bacterium]
MNAPRLLASVFKTRLGWCGIVYNEKYNGKKEVERTYLPTSKSKAREYVKNFPLKNFAGMERKIRAYFKGGKIDFSGVECALDRCPPFHKKVYKKLMNVPYGKTVTYAELARMAGNPKASRAVGSAMAKNPMPLIIPCHRVIKSNGEIGNFSSDRGPALKAKMLGIEGNSSLLG